MLIIKKEDFITEMVKRNGVTKKASREYTEMFLNTFFELLTEGHTIRFWRLFSARILTSAEANSPDELVKIADMLDIELVFIDKSADVVNGNKYTITSAE